MGGVDRVILKIAQHYDAKIYTLEYDRSHAFPEFADLDIEVFGRKDLSSKVLPYRASQGFRYGTGFYSFKIKEDYDVLNPHISPSEWIRHKNERVLWYCHTPPREVYDLYEVRMHGRSTTDKLVYAAMVKSYRFIAGGIVKKIEAIATNSENTKRRINKYFKRDATVVNPGIDYNLFSNKGDEKFFFYPSRIVSNKRQDFVVEAFRQFSKRNKGSNHKLVLAGSVSNDPEHKAYLAKLKKASAGLNVKIIENAPDSKMRDLYSRCSAVMFSAINEDYGFIPLEAMSSYKPIISVNEGGPRETIMDGKTGFLVDSVSSMAEKMSFVAQNPDIAEEMGVAGRRHVERNYTWNNFFEKMDPLLRKVSKM